MKNEECSSFFILHYSLLIINYLYQLLQHILLVVLQLQHQASLVGSSDSMLR